jgi:hypothetical protein
MTPEKFDLLQESVERIERAIVGDRQMGHRGIADRLEYIERKVAGHEKQILRWVGAITLAGIAVPILTKLFI